MYYTWGAALIVVEAILIVHAHKRGRDNWIWLILFFPLVGCLAYVISFMLPGIRTGSGSASAQETGEKVVRMVAPSRKLQKLRDQLEFSDTLANRQLLAREYMHIGGYEDAAELYESCLEGAYEDDPYIMLDAARARFLSHSFHDAKKHLLVIKEQHVKFSRIKDALLLLSMTYEALSEFDAALAEYKAVAGILPGEEGRCRYALLLKKNSQLEEANTVFNEVIYRTRTSPGYYRRSQRQWVNLAKQHLYGS